MPYDALVVTGLFIFPVDFGSLSLRVDALRSRSPRYGCRVLRLLVLQFLPLPFYRFICCSLPYLRTRHAFFPGLYYLQFTFRSVDSLVSLLFFFALPTCVHSVVYAVYFPICLFLPRSPYHHSSLYYVYAFCCYLVLTAFAICHLYPMPPTVSVCVRCCWLRCCLPFYTLFVLPLRLYALLLLYVPLYALYFYLSYGYFTGWFVVSPLHGYATARFATLTLLPAYFLRACRDTLPAFADYLVRWFQLVRCPRYLPGLRFPTTHLTITPLPFVRLFSSSWLVITVCYCRLLVGCCCVVTVVTGCGWFPFTARSLTLLRLFACLPPVAATFAAFGYAHHDVLYLHLVDLLLFRVRSCCVTRTGYPITPPPLRVRLLVLPQLPALFVTFTPVCCYVGSIFTRLDFPFPTVTFAVDSLRWFTF